VIGELKNIDQYDTLSKMMKDDTAIDVKIGTIVANYSKLLQGIYLLISSLLYQHLYLLIFNEYFSIILHYL
jgi:hypothetical protein